GRFAAGTTQIIELRATHDALAVHLDGNDIRRIEREDALDALAERNLADSEGGTEALVRAGNAHAFIILDAGAIALDDLHADFQRVTGTEFRNLLVLV